jgi:hypothetical protein
MTRPKIRTTILSLVTALVIAAVAAPLASAGSIGSIDPYAQGVVPAPTTIKDTQDNTIYNGPIAMAFDINDYGSDVPAGYWRVNVYGTWQMSADSAQAALDAGYRVVFRLYGEDPGPDPQLFGPYEYRDGKKGAISTGLWFDDYHLFLPKYSVLNEDRPSWLNGNDQQDEVYAKVQVLDPNGNVVQTATSTVKRGYF